MVRLRAGTYERDHNQLRRGGLLGRRRRKVVERTSSKWKTRSSSHTFSNALSRDSTKTYARAPFSTPFRRMRSRYPERSHLYEIEDAELALRDVDDEHEVQRRVAAVHDAQLLARGAALGREERLELGRVEEVAEPGLARGHERVDALDEGLRGVLDGRVELRQPGHARGVDCGRA